MSKEHGTLPSRQSSEVLVDVDLFDSALRRDRSAVGVAPWVVVRVGITSDWLVAEWPLAVKGMSCPGRHGGARGTITGRSRS
ncbi:MAG: hypothetical protein ACRDSZ_18615 [Pseudonocardiaceae bacterium]